MNKILVAFDCSSEAKKALEHAINIANPDQEIEVLSIIPEPDSIIEPGSEPEISRQTIEQHLIEFKEKFDAKGLRYIIKITHGDIIREIISASEDPDVQLIVLGYKGITNIGKFRLGSVSGEVAKLANKPVLVIK